MTTVKRIDTETNTSERVHYKGMAEASPTYGANSWQRGTPPTGINSEIMDGLFDKYWRLTPQPDLTAYPYTNDSKMVTVPVGPHAQVRVQPNLTHPFRAKDQTVNAKWAQIFLFS